MCEYGNGKGYKMASVVIHRVSLEISRHPPGTGPVSLQTDLRPNTSVSEYQHPFARVRMF